MVGIYAAKARTALYTRSSKIAVRTYSYERSSLVPVEVVLAAILEIGPTVYTARGYEHASVSESSSLAPDRVVPNERGTETSAKGYTTLAFYVAGSTIDES